MDVRVETRFLPALAESITQWFPELGGRALAVSEATITKENVPTLPLCMIAFVRSVSDQPVNVQRSTITMSDTFVVEFWMKPERYKRANGTESPFWSYYDYEAIRNTLLSNMVEWVGPHRERCVFRSLTIEADPLAVVLTFQFLATYQWCADLLLDDMSTIITEDTIESKICLPKALDCD